MQLGDLRPGQTFHQPTLGIDGRVLRVNRGSVSVELTQQRERSFQTEAGERITFTVSRRRTTWSQRVEVEPR